MKHKKQSIFYGVLLSSALLCGNLMAFGSININAQQEISISGVVKDAETDQPLPGVNIIEKGTNNGTVSDIDGEFQLSVEEGAVLIFSFIGYSSKEIQVGANQRLEVALSPDIQNLDEVVVIGYGTSRVKDLTGSISRVGEEDFLKGVNTSPDQLIQGKIPGVNIINNSGAPGGAVTFRIRGASSVRTGNQPLFVVDGLPLDGRNTNPGARAGELGATPASNPLNFINPADIESIDVLKDASATAIYGSRGANGVVIITTKKGMPGKPRMDLNLSSGVSVLRNKPDIMNGETFRQALEQRNIEGYDGDGSVDTFDAITRTAFTHIANFSISGGTEEGNYRISAGLHDQEGIIRKSGLTKYTGSFNGGFNFLPENRIKLDVNLIASQTTENAAPIAEDSNVNGSLTGNAIEWNPTVPFRYPDGAFVQRVYNAGGVEVQGLPTNPLALIEYYDDASDITNILGSISATLKIIDGLNYRISYGVNHVKGNRRVDTSGDLFLSTITDLGLAVANSSELTSGTFTNTLDFSQTFNNTTINALLGYEYQTYKQYSTNISATGFTSFDVLGSDILQNPSQDNVNISSYRDPLNELQSYFGRFNVNFSDRFLVTATLRADGSTKFGANNKYGLFPSFAGAWVLSEESFLAGANTLNNLKLRVGWGRTGNQEFPAGASRERYQYNRGQIALANVANPDLKWETSETFNVGVDFSLFSRLSGTIEYFDKSTQDLLMQLPTIQPAPAAQYWTNLPAIVHNKGVEASLKTVLVTGGELYWDIGINASFLDNKLTNYDGAPILTGQINGNGLGGGSNAQQLVNDQPLYVFKMLEFQGFDENGIARYSDEQQFVGDPNPDVLLGFTTNFEMGRFGLTMNWNGAFGHQLYNNTANAVITAANFALGRNTSEEIGLGNENLGNANVVSTRFLESGDYFKMQNISASYLLPFQGAIRNVRLTLTGQNLLVLTNYSGFDPEVNTNRAVNGVPSFGIEYIPYPSARTITLGLSASF